MTCIVAVEHEGAVYLGGDSAAVDTDSLLVCSLADEKVFMTESEDMVMGFAGSFRIGQLMRYALQMPIQKVGQDDMAFMVVDFIDAVRTSMSSRGSLKKEDEVEEHDTHIVVGFNGKLYVIEEDFHIERPILGYTSIGTGAQIALGALHATQDSGKSPEDRINCALTAAAKFNAGVRKPFHVVKLPKSEE